MPYHLGYSCTYVVVIAGRPASIFTVAEGMHIPRLTMSSQNNRRARSIRIAMHACKRKHGQYDIPDTELSAAGHIVIVIDIQGWVCPNVHKTKDQPVLCHGGISSPGSCMLITSSCHLRACRSPDESRRRSKVMNVNVTKY